MQYELARDKQVNHIYCIRHTALFLSFVSFSFTAVAAEMLCIVNDINPQSLIMILIALQ